MADDARPVLGQLNLVVADIAAGGRLGLVVDDADGNPVGLVSPLDPGRRGALPTM